MAINKLISIRVPVFEALEDMGIDHGKNIPVITRWAASAERSIGSYYSYKRKIDVIKVCKFRAELPCDAMYVQRVLLGDYGKDSADLFNYVCSVARAINVTQTDTFLVIDKPENSRDVLLSPIRWEVQDNHIVLNENYDDQYLTIQYIGLQTDLDGFPMVLENHTEAIVNYILYRFARRSRFSREQKMELGDVKMLKDEWEASMLDARADDSATSESDRQAIVALLHDPLSGIGMEVGMHNRFDY